MPENKSNSQMAIVFLSSDTLPSRTNLAKAINARIPSASLAEDEARFLFFVEDMMCSLMLLEAPAPVVSGDPCFKTAWYWPNAWDVVKAQKAHIMAAATGGADPKKRAALFCQLVAALIEAAPNAIAVHCASCDGPFPAQAIPSMITPHSGAIATPLVVSAKLMKDCEAAAGPKPAISAVTRGLSAFGLREIEALGFAGGPGGLNTRFWTSPPT